MSYNNIQTSPKNIAYNERRSRISILERIDYLREAQYQARIIQKLRDLFPGCFILKNDAIYTPGVPDIIILYNDHWAMLEIKYGNVRQMQPNQEYYVNMLNSMSYASFINPDNEEEVFYDLQIAFGFIRPPRVS